MSNPSDNKQHYLEILSRFSSDLIRKNRVEDVLWCITENAISELGFEDCVIYLVNETGEYLVQRAAYGAKDSGKHEIVEPIKIPIGIGVVGHVAKVGVGEIVEDCSLDPRYIEDDAQRNSEITVPILQNGKVIGVIDSEHSQLAYYNDEHLAVLNAIASIAGIRLSQIKVKQSVERDRDLFAERIADKKYELQMAMHQLQQTNAQLERLVEEKSQLLNELHHRVKNQMQMMHSLINLQSNEVESEEVKANLLICMNRVRCMGLVYQMAEGLTVDAAQYLRALNDELHSSYGIYPSTPYEVTVTGPDMGTDKTVLLGFIMVDLFSAGIKSLEGTEGPKSSMIVDINEHCSIQFNSNWWGFDQLSELTDLFIAQIGASKIDSDEADLHLVCKI